MQPGHAAYSAHQAATKHLANKAESRFVKLSFSYKLGNKNGKASQRRNTGIEAEKSRMDN
jgi:hypothetical protein